MLIAVEGMDGVGKTTIARYISDKYSFIFIEKPLHYFYNDDEKNNYNDLMKVANKLYDIDDNVLKSWYFSLGNIYVSRMFNDKNVVIDRHLVSTYYWNGSTESDIIYKTLIEVGGVPDLTILLYASPKVRMKRLESRNKNDPDLSDPEKKDDGFDKMTYFLEKFSIPYTIINTDEKTIEEVEACVDEEISKLNVVKRRLIKK